MTSQSFDAWKKLFASSH